MKFAGKVAEIAARCVYWWQVGFAIHYRAIWGFFGVSYGVLFRGTEKIFSPIAAQKRRFVHFFDNFAVFLKIGVDCSKLKR